MLRAIVLAGLLLPGIAFAQSERSGGERTQELIYDDADLIEAGVATPELSVIEGQRPSEHPSIIQIRESFGEKVVGSVSEL